MTISTEVRKAGPFIGNGSASVFPFAFKVFKAADLIVVRRQDNIGTETTLVLDSDYHVTLNSNQDTTPGGVVTLVAGALASGFTLVVSSELPYLQTTDLTNQGGFYPKVITNALDRLTIFCQQLAEITGRTLKLPITAPTNISAEIPLPNPSELIAWNETGTGLTTVSPQSLVTSIAYGSATADLFAGDGVTTTFPLTTNPASVNNLDVSIGGHSQRPVQGGVGDYSWNGGASITFVVPPPAPTVPGDKNVLVRYMQAIPVSDSEALHAQTREALRRGYAEAGFNLVDGSFETGGTLTSATDVLLQESTGAAYAWTGALPKTVAPGFDPVGVAGFELRNLAVLRGELVSEYGSSLIGSSTYAQIRAYTGSATKINCLGRTNAFDKAHGDFYLDATDTTTPDDDGVVLVDALGRRWKRRFIERVLPEWWGASANIAIDSSAALQEAFDWKYVRLSDGDYKASTPLYMDGETNIKGPGTAKCSISKTSTALGSGSNLARGGAVTDSYAVNAVIIIRHGDNDYNYNSSISGVKLAGYNYSTEVGIYAPRTSQIRLYDVLMWQCQIGWLTHDSWMANWDKVIANANSQPGAYGWASATGFEWRDDSAGTFATGTTLSARNCWARDCSDGWKLVGLGYSSLDACGADNLIGGVPYFFKACSIVLNGCGMENIKLANGGAAIYAELSKVTMNSCRGYAVQGAPEAAYFHVTSMSQLVLNTCMFDNFTVANGSYNRIVADGSSIDATSSVVPANGSVFAGTLSNGAYIRETVGDEVRIKDASGERYLSSSYNAPNSINKVGKAVLSSGSAILTLTCNGSGGVEQAVAKLKINWSDASYPTGAGYSEVSVVCHQDSGINYREAITTSVNIGAGNGFTTAPAYTIARSGNTWSVIMTPSGGDLTCSFTVDADYSGFTLATP